MEDNHTTATNIAQIEEMSALQLVETILRQSDIAPCVIIDVHQNVVYVHGRLGQYLEPAEGRGSRQILEMARTPQLKNELNNCIRKVLLHNKTVSKKAINIQSHDNKALLDLTVKPLQKIGSLNGLIMITFIEKGPKTKDKADKKAESSSLDNEDATLLRQELESTRESLQTTIEELETSNEELKSSNEELQSTNEELQSTNEELETSKEELQSLNEESITVNAELQSRIDELSQTNDDIKNLLDSTQTATLFLDSDLNIRRFTPKMTEIINLVSTDINRPISHLSTCLHDVKLTDFADKVLKTLDKIETEVSSEKEIYYTMRILPYRTINNVIDGVVISFEDITHLKNIEFALRKNEQRYKSMFEHSPVAILELDVTHLQDYLNQHQLSHLNQLEKQWSKHANNKERLMSGIKVLNINELGLHLFDAKSKEIVLNCLPTLLDKEEYLFQQLSVIIDKKESHTFNTRIHTLKEKTHKAEITINTPKVDDQLNHKNTIVVISPVGS